MTTSRKNACNLQCPGMAAQRHCRPLILFSMPIALMPCMLCKLQRSARLSLPSVMATNSAIKHFACRIACRGASASMIGVSSNKYGHFQGALTHVGYTT